jgi:NAD(P)H-quinone oxidoreductase subunit 5
VPPGVSVRGAALAVGVTLAYFALQFAAHHVLDAALPDTAATAGAFGIALGALVIASFMAVLWLQAELPWRAQDPRWHAAYVHIHNGLYLNAWANRLVQRLWPLDRGVTEGATR